MPNLTKALKQRLEGARTIGILGVGSDLRGDDAAGMLVAEGIKARLKKKAAGTRKVKVFLGATAPENLTGEIMRYKPAHLIIIDTIDIKQKPGTILVLKPEDFGGGVSFSTHTMPSKILIQYLLNSMDCVVTMIGVQPKTIAFGKPVTKSVLSATEEIITAIAAAVR
ncbi:MAG: hydrogenase maturation protease [Candidatus Omnitrophica bacterium]|nr:hydrogenase maturation protease [Candidatus Omnitrophota bacterium]